MLTAIRWLLTVSGWISSPFAARVAGVLFCLPLPLSLSARRKAPPAGSELLFVPCGRHRIAVYRWPAAGLRAGRILLVHGWAGRGSQWRHFVQPLREAGFEVLVLDQPAHGRSSGWTVNLPQCIRVVQKVAQVFGPLSGIVGHSFGGNAVAVAAATGLEAERVVLVSALADPEREIERFAEIVGLPDDTRRAMQRHFEVLEEMPLAELHADHAGPRIPQPVLLVHDRDDDVIPYDDALGYARRIPQARLLATEGLHHRRILREESVIREVVQFLSTAATGRVAA